MSLTSEKRGFLLRGALPLALLVLAAAAQPAAASVTLGQTATSTPPSLCSNIPDDWVQPSVTTGNSYEVPGPGTIVSWSTWASSTAGQHWSLKIYRPVPGVANKYKVIARDGPRDLTVGALNVFPVSIPVQHGDLIGMQHNDGNPDVATACTLVATGNTAYFGGGEIPDGQEGSIASVVANRHLNITAEFNPANTFTLGPIARDRKRGRASFSINVPNAGTVAGGGAGVRVLGAPAGGAPVLPGTVPLALRARASKKHKLNKTGKAKVKVKVTYTPTGGDPRSQTLKVKLRKRV